jgi:hypothetical protein
MSVRLVHRPADWLIPHQVHSEDGTYLAGFRTQGKALGHVRRNGWKVVAPCS